MCDFYYKDGRPYNPPVNPLLEKWNRKYPPTPMPQYSQVCDGYSCMWCGRCPKGDGWKVPTEDKLIYDEWRQSVNEYHRINGGYEDLMITANIMNLII